MNNIKSTQIKALSFGASVFTLATILGSAQDANAATFNFSFSNVEGLISGTVEGTIELPDGDGTFAATALTVTSAPAALGYTLPFDGLVGDVITNTFTVASGVVTDSEFLNGTLGGVTGTALTLSFTGFGSLLNVPGSANIALGVADSTDSTLTFTPADTQTTPEPSTILGLLVVGSLGALTRKGKKG